VFYKQGRRAIQMLQYKKGSRAIPINATSPGQVQGSKPSGLDGPKLILHSMSTNMYKIHFSQLLSQRQANSQSEYPFADRVT